MPDADKPDEPRGSTPQTRAISPAEAARRQAVYAASRRAWAERLGRPYQDEADPRPPPGQLDAGPDE